LTDFGIGSLVFIIREINPSSEHRELFVGCWSLMTSMGGNSHCNCPGLNNSLWWRSKLNIKKWNAILYKTNTYIFALRKTTTTQLPCYYYIYWTLFSAHWLCYIHIDTTSSDCGLRDYPFYFVLGYQSVSVASYSESCLVLIHAKDFSCLSMCSEPTKTTKIII
jgi:hypothetical protein